MHVSDILWATKAWLITEWYPTRHIINQNGPQVEPVLKQFTPVPTITLHFFTSILISSSNRRVNLYKVVVSRKFSLHRYSVLPFFWTSIPSAAPWINTNKILLIMQIEILCGKCSQIRLTSFTQKAWDVEYSLHVTGLWQRLRRIWVIDKRERER
jgi:hypothetical protein